MAKPKARRRATQKSAETKKKRRVLVYSLAMVALMVLSFSAVILYNPTTGDNQLTYGDYEFRLENRGAGGQALVTEINGQTVEFQNLPSQVTYLEFDPATTQLLRDAQQVALSADPHIDPDAGALIDYARLELSLAIPKMFNAMTAESDFNLPIITCNMSSAQMPVILFDYTNETAQVVTDGYCIHFIGSERDLMRIKDRTIFEYYDIMKEVDQ